MLVYVVDATLGSRDMGGLTPVEQLELLRQELRHYDPTLLAKPSLVAANKMDAATEESQKLVASLRESTPWDVIEISGLKKQGMDQLMAHVRKLSPTDMD